MGRRYFDCPHGFYVRYYDDKLCYTVHIVIPYKTSSPKHLIYKVTRSYHKVNVWLSDDGIIAQSNIQGHGDYIRFSSAFTLDEIVCIMLSKAGKFVVVDDRSIQLPLF